MHNQWIPSSYKIDYDAALSVAPDGVSNLVLFLRETLPSLWRDAYLAADTRQTNLVELRLGTFDYVCDVCSDLESSGEVAYDQTAQDRVVAAFGISGTAKPPNANRSAHWINPNEHLATTERDHGHLIARCIGGSGLRVNVFSQARLLNRGRSDQGRLYRQMEAHCSKRPGTFCFSRPIYADGSCVPRWVEFGVLKADQTLWVETFDN